MCYTVRYPVLVSLQSPDKLSCLSWSGVSRDQAWSQAAFKECLAGVSSILLQQLKYSLPPPSPVLSGWQPHVMDSLVPASHEAHTWSLLLWNQAPMYWQQLFKQGHSHWVPAVLEYLTPGASDTHFLLRSVSEGQSTLKPGPLGLKTTEHTVRLPP